MSIATIWALISGTWMGRILAGGTVLLVAWKANNYAVASATKAKIVRASKAEGKKRNERASKLREAARKPGAADRLLADHCRDC